jgi:rhodanese-related sulfurtransferase
MEFLNSNTIPKNVTLIDTRSYNEYKSGHIKGAMNIEYKDNPQEFIDRTSHIDGAFILYCSTGTRSIDAYTSIQKLKNKTKDRFFYFDATVQCDNKNRCNIEPNFSLDF